MSSAIIGTGILLKKGNGASPAVYTTLAEIVKLKPAGLSRNEIDVSTHNAGIEEKILGMLRTGQVTGMINYVPTHATHDQTTGLLADITANTEASWRIEFPPSASPKFTFLARVQLFDIQEITTDSPMQANFALTINGAIVIS